MDTITSVSVISPPPQFHGDKKGKGKAKADDSSLYSLSLRLSTALSEYLEFTPLGKTTQQDIQEILDAVDQLSSAITRQTSTLWEHSKGAVSTMHAKLEKRNERAKKRAKQIRHASECWIRGMTETIKTRAEVAKVNAKAIGERVVQRMEARHAHAREQGRKTRKQRRAERKERRAARSYGRTRVEVKA